MKKIIETITNDKTLTTLLSAINKAQFSLMLSGDGPFTVLAPNDEAFAKVKLEAILKDESKLKEILSYHVISSKVMGKDARDVKELNTAQGGKIVVDTTNGVMFNNAKVVTADIECGNGVIHIIDTVLMPK